VVVALGLTIVLGFGAYTAAIRFAALYARIDIQAAVVTATATGALLLASIIIAASIRRAGAQDRNSRLRGDKAQVYRLFIGLWEEVLRPGQTEEALDQLSPQMRDVRHLLVMYGCATVVKAHAAMHSLSLPEARVQFADALVAIRQDLGVESRGLDAKNLIRLVLDECGPASRPARPGIRQDTQPRVSLAANS
jgi:hypothetical protein